MLLIQLSSLLLLLPLVFADSSSTTVTLPFFHRLSPSSSWTQRGSLHLDLDKAQGWLEEVPGGEVESLKVAKGAGGGGGKYFVGVEGQDGRMRSVVGKDCKFSSTGSSETLQLFFSPPASANSPTSASDLTHLAFSCAPSTTSTKEFNVLMSNGVSVLPVQYKEVKPVEVDAEGKVVEPPKEKTFFEKYWMYILPVVAMLILSPGEEPAKKE